MNNKIVNYQLSIINFLIFALILFGGCAGQPPVKNVPVIKVETGDAAEALESKNASKEIGDAVNAEEPGLRPVPFEDVNRQRTHRKEVIEVHEIRTGRPAPSYAEADTYDKISAPEKMPPLAPHPSPLTPRPPASGPGDVVLNFDNADLYEVIRNMAKLLNISYIVDPNVRGTVTIHTAGQLRKNDLFPVFFQILEANGLTAVREGSLYKIISLKDASRMPVTPRFGYPDDVSPEERIIIQIIPLRFISGQEITKLLTPFISAEGSIITHEDSNTLLVVDKAVNILKALKLIKVFDVNVFEKVNHRVYHLEYVGAEDTAKTLTDIINAYGSVTKDAVKFIPVERLNNLIVISSVGHIFDKIQQIIRQIDVPVHDIEPRIYVYFVKNGAAAELSELLNSVFSGDSSSEKEKVIQKDASSESKKNKSEPEPVRTPFGAIRSKTKRTKAERILSETQSSGTLKGEIKITSDEIRNALVIEALPSDYELIEDILKRLDVLPRQVLIEVTVADIQLNTKTELGIEWSYIRGSGRRPDTSTLEAKMGIKGLQYMIGQADRWFAALSALASDKKINILSSPTVLASDNKEAKINISTEVPVASATYNKDDSDVIETNIQYRNTGVILSVTPHINEYGLVSMDISQEVSNQLEDNIQVGNTSMPAFFKRSVNTSLTVKHGQTIVIGGLIQQTDNKGTSGVPCLNTIPILQYLFGKKSDSIDKTELILLITPRVISTLEDIDAVTEEFKHKVGNIIEGTKNSGSEHINISGPGR
ncbi:type II secretion system secretin GspD [Desulfonema magnum]|uniref:type II secretion system secretin GspD n=1 Tax=Desulfonema magnum TaxID=45655 RepID=UPI001A9B6865|nr:type II secretion system secretin GspD [Desulfonema magnum]